MNHFETSWRSDDGIDIFAQGWSPEAIQPKAVVCLVHGVGEHTSRYLHDAEVFTSKGWALFGADLRGHGRSGGPRGHFPSIDAILSDIDLFLSQAGKHYRDLPLILYGQSLGGILVLHYVLKKKPLVKGVVVTSPALHNSLEKQQLKVLTAKVLGSLLPTLTIPSGLDVSALSHDREVVKLYSNDPLVHDRISFGFGKIMLGVTGWTLRHASEFSLPLLLMHGKSDSIALPSSSIEFAAALDGKCRLVLWDDAFHELHNETFKSEVFETMTSWIGELLTER
jgi:acylglycerol lipase